MVDDEAADPVDVRFLGPRAEMARTDRLADGIEQPRRLRVGHSVRRSCVNCAGPG